MTYVTLCDSIKFIYIYAIFALYMCNLHVLFILFLFVGSMGACFSFDEVWKHFSFVEIPKHIFFGRSIVAYFCLVDV